MNELSDDPSKLLQGTGRITLFKAVEEDGEEFFDAVNDEDELDAVSRLMEHAFLEKYDGIAEAPVEYVGGDDSDDFLSDDELDRIDSMLDSYAVEDKEADESVEEEFPDNDDYRFDFIE